MLMTTCINNTNANARPLLCFTFIASLLLLNLILFLTYYSESGITNDISGVSNVLSHHALAAHGIQDLNGISLTSLSKSSNSSSETHSTPRIVYISGHFGTVQDFKNVARLLNISSSVSIFNPRALGYYGQSMDSAKKLNQEHWMGDFFCDSFDIAVVGDTNPDARFLLKRIDDSPDEPDPSGHKDWWRIGKDEETQRPCRMKRLIFQTTNRFDYFVGDDNSDKHDGWYNLIRRTAHRRDEKVVWVANNPWEPRHMEINMKGAYVEPITIIRPLGISDLAESNNNRNSFTNLVNVKNNDTHLAVFIDNSVNGFPSFAKENNLTHLIKFLPKHYGGPLELKKYKFVVEIPYQMSTMKIYENLAYGIITYIPTSRYYQDYFNRFPEKFTPWLPYFTKEPELHNPSNWTEYFEYYNSEFKDYFYTFDSVEELRSQLESDDADPRNLSSRSISMMQQMRKRTLNDWNHLLHTN